MKKIFIGILEFILGFKISTAGLKYLRFLFPGKILKEKCQLESILGPIKIKLDAEKAKEILGLKEELHVTLTQGPIDHVLGFLNRKNGELEIDVLEIFLAHKPKNLQEFDDAITRTVCHEFWHAKQKERYGKWFFLLSPLLMSAFLFFYFFFLLPFVSLSFYLFGENIFSFLVGLFFDLRFGLRIAFLFGYFLSPAEIGARLYARRHYRDEEWRDVVIVEEASREEIFMQILDVISGGEIKFVNTNLK